ncbi:MAG: 7-cyano-7-deazaguanine synthase [Colwellia sp.]|nr:7-cyano-7-deazaguanine synthase [Colwellia sp.]
MDNLFAAIALNQCSQPIKHLINNRFSSEYFAYSLTALSEISDDNYFICLAYYASNNSTLVKKTPPTTNALIRPIISNVRVDNKNINTNRHNFIAPDQSKAFTRADDCFIYHQYTDLGANCFSGIKGDFQTVIWDDNSKTLCAALSAFNSRSLFYLQLDGILYIASDAQFLAKATQTQLSINKVAVSQWLSGRPNPDLSMFNEISRLPAGHCLEYSQTHGIKITKFWEIDPDFSVVYPNTADYKDHFFELLQTSVVNRLAVNSATEHSSVFCQMSGGMDSTSVTAIAKQQLDKENRPLHTLSHRYKNTQSCDESNNIADMILTLKLENQHFVELDKFDNISFAQLYPTDFDNPGVVLSPKYHQELTLMNSLGASVLMTGNGGDETCWGHSASYRSRLFKGELGVISEVIHACGELNEPVVRSLYKLFMPSALQNLIKIARNKPRLNDEYPRWLSPQALAMVKSENLLFSNPFSATFNSAKHARYHGLKTTSTYNSMRSYQKVASIYGIDVRHPFFDTDIVEFSFAIPEKLLIQGAYPKWLLRQAMQNHLPASVCWNKQKTVFDHHFANLVRANKAELRKLLSHPGLHDLGLINNDILLEEFDAVVNNPNGYLNVDMLYAILTQLWFQTHVI